MTAITSRTFTHGPSLSIPRGASAAAAVFLAGGRLLRRMLSSQAKAGRDGATTIGRHAREAQEVRAIAQRWERSDPGFAADLYAAASRHEGLDD